MNEEFYDLTQGGAQVQAILNKAALLPDNPGVVIEGKIAPAVSITYAALKALRDGGTLKPGQYYRITDYVTTTAQAETQSAGHLFDIIVRADSASTLSESAYAARHDGDTYFQNANLEAWRLKYCLDNDTTRFAWADATNGKGVIYEMQDEYGNSLPFDFKNIQFKRYKITATSLIVGGQEVLAQLKNTYLGFRQLVQSGTGSLYPQNCTMSTSDTRWSFALSLNGTQDLTLQANHHCTGNVVEPCFFKNKQYLNNVTLQATSATADSYNNRIDGTSHSISLGNGCYNNTLTQNSNTCTLSSSNSNTLSSSGDNTLSSSWYNTLSSSDYNTLSSNFYAELIGCNYAVVPEGSTYEQGIGGYMVEDGLYIKNYGQRRTVNVFLAEYGSEDSPVIDETITLEAGQVYYVADTYFEPSEDSYMTFTEGGKNHKYGFNYY